MNDVIMSDADFTPGREPRSVATSTLLLYWREASESRSQGYSASSVTRSVVDDKG